MGESITTSLSAARPIRITRPGVGCSPGQGNVTSCPNVTRSDGRTRCGLTTRRPCTNVPLVEPRSSIEYVSPMRRRRQCRSDTVARSTTISHSAPEPIIHSCLLLNVLQPYLTRRPRVHVALKCRTPPSTSLPQGTRRAGGHGFLITIVGQLKTGTSHQPENATSKTKLPRLASGLLVGQRQVQYGSRQIQGRIASEWNYRNVFTRLRFGLVFEPEWRCPTRTMRHSAQNSTGRSTFGA